MATPKPKRAASKPDDGSGECEGAGAAGGGGSDVSLTVDAVPVEVVTPLEESIRVAASSSLPADFVVAVEVSAAMLAESPEPVAVWLLPRRLVVALDAVASCWVVVAPPVPPVDPELPVMATGLEMAVDVAGPVLPVLVADDEACTSPEFPDWATGVITTLGEPPEPPLAPPLLVESPPLVAAAAAGPSRATAAAATPAAPAMQTPPASRAFFTVVIGCPILALLVVLVSRSPRARLRHEPDEPSTAAGRQKLRSVTQQPVPVDVTRQRGRLNSHWRPRMPAAPAAPTPLSTIGHAGIFPSPGLVSSRGMVAVAGVGPAVVGGRVPATVVGVVVGGVVLGPVVDARRGTVLATVGLVVAGASTLAAALTAIAFSRPWSQLRISARPRPELHVHTERVAS